MCSEGKSNLWYTGLYSNQLASGTPLRRASKSSANLRASTVSPEAHVQADFLLFVFVLYSVFFYLNLGTQVYCGGSRYFNA